MTGSWYQGLGTYRIRLTPSGRRGAPCERSFQPEADTAVMGVIVVVHDGGCVITEVWSEKRPPTDTRPMGDFPQE
ncbi:MAG: hypothetical protein AB1938_14525 [Myxococcota bacterium]